MKTLEQSEILQINNLYEKGWSLNKISKEFDFGKTTVYYHVRKKFGKKIKPLEINLEKREILGEFLGSFIGDGHFDFDTKRYKYRIVFYLSPNEPLFLKRLSNIIFQIFRKKPNIWYDKKGHVYRVILHGKEIYMLLKNFLIWKKNKTQTIHLNQKIFRDKELMKGIIRGLINTDGNVYDRKCRISFGSISKILIYQCSKILNEFKIDYKLYKINRRKNHKNFYSIVIEGDKRIFGFNKQIGLIHSDKQKQIEEILLTR